MIRYTVLWRQEAESELAQIWCDATDRSEITAAVDQIDAELSTDAQERGESSVHDGLRWLANGPLVVFFRVEEGDRKVFVYGVQAFDP